MAMLSLLLTAGASALEPVTVTLPTLLVPPAAGAASAPPPPSSGGWAQDFSCDMSYQQTTPRANQTLTGSAFVSGSTKKIRFSMSQSIATGDGQTQQQPLTIIQDQGEGTQYTIYQNPHSSNVVCMRQPISRNERQGAAGPAPPAFQGYTFLGKRLAAVYILSHTARGTEGLFIDPFTNLPAGLIQTGGSNQTLASFENLVEGPQAALNFALPHGIVCQPHQELHTPHELVMLGQQVASLPSLWS